MRLVEGRALRGLLVIAACGLALGGPAMAWLGPPRAAARPPPSARPYVAPPQRSSVTDHRVMGTASIDNQAFPAPRLYPIDVILMHLLIGAGMQISRVDCLGPDCLALRVFDRAGGVIIALSPGDGPPPTCSDARSAARENGMIAGGDPIDAGVPLLVGRRGPFIVETLDAQLWAELQGTFTAGC